MQRLNILLTHGLLALAVVALQACGGGGGGEPIASVTPGTNPGTTPGTNPGTTPSGPAAITNPPNNTSNPPPITPAPSAGQVQITGVASYESVTNRAGSAALDYGNITTKPLRGMLIAAVSGSTIISSATTSDTGAYALNVPANTNLAVAIGARLVRTSGPANWDISVYDNTDGGSLWVIQGPEANSGAANSSRNIKAPLGWNATTKLYDAAQRASGPFAILDTIYTSMQLVTSVAPATQFPVLEVYWSPNNRPASGNLTTGDIGTSFFTQQTNSVTQAITGRALFILGKEGADTDEFDSGVVAHEFGHYLQSAFSQSHSTGGPHSTGNYLDMTLSYGEGWGYAFASLARNSLDNPDSSGPGQASGGIIRTGTAPALPNNGWFSETSVQYVIYQLGVEKGFAPIWASFSGPMKNGQDALNTVFSFAAGVRSAAASAASSLNALLTAQKIFAGTGADQWGTGETNNGGNPNNLDAYTQITIGGQAKQICFNNNKNDPSNNKLGEQRYIRFTNPTAGPRTITLSFDAATGMDLDYSIYQGGNVVAISETGSATGEIFNRSLPAGEIVIRAFDDRGSANTADTTKCATISVN